MKINKESFSESFKVGVFGVLKALPGVAILSSAGALIGASTIFDPAFAVLSSGVFAKATAFACLGGMGTVGAIAYGALSCALGAEFIKYPKRNPLPKKLGSLFTSVALAVGLGFGGAKAVVAAYDVKANSKEYTEYKERIEKEAEKNRITDFTFSCKGDFKNAGMKDVDMGGRTIKIPNVCTPKP